MKRTGQLLFIAAFAVAMTLYGLTMPDGLPWNDSTHLALAYLGEIVQLPEMPHPIWGFHVQVLGGAMRLAVLMSALAAGLLAAIVNRYFGWRFAAGAALVWTFMPSVWNRAICGQRGVVIAAMAVVAVWTVNAIGLWATRKARDAAKKEVAQQTKRGKWNRIAGLVFLGTSAVFALVSMSIHDYMLGEPASVFAKGIVEAAGNRIIVANGVVDDQIVIEGERVKDERVKSAVATLTLRNDDAYRTNLVAWAKATFPDETNLWVAAQVGAQAFVEVALTKHLERFYLTNGKSTTHDALEKRWKEFEPYLKSSDRFVRVGRRLFGYEGNAVANAMLDEVKGERVKGERAKGAYLLYKRIYEEIDPKNISALINMNEMIRQGYAVSGEEKNRVQERLDAFFSDANNRKHAPEIVRSAGPIRANPALMEKMAEDAKKRIAAKIAAGEKIQVSPEILTLVEWNNEMVTLVDKGEIVKAGRIARAILSNPKWKSFIPANAVMGTVASHDGDYVASEAFFRVATATTNMVAPVVLNDFADTLMRLGKIGEAERIARRAVRESDEQFWLARLTLAEVLEKKNDVGTMEEIGTLLKSAIKHAPPEMKKRIRNTPAFRFKAK